MSKLKSPYPYFGGKSKVAAMAWKRIGNTPNFIEPFFGSGAFLLGRPDWHFKESGRIETVNDIDGMIANFWRAVKAKPNAVAAWADGPVNECDLHARHNWLVATGKARVEMLKTDPDYFDVKIAGWWVWGMCQWIGGGWCAGTITGDGDLLRKRPHLGNKGRGIARTRPHLGDGGRGVLRMSRDIAEYIDALSERLKRVRVCCGDWSRICGDSVTIENGVSGVFLDPPYSHAERHIGLYREDHDVAADVRQWCIDNGSDERKRVALCGYEGEGHRPLEELGWDCAEWKADGGYGLQSTTADGRANASRERIWFSPSCIPANEPDLFAGDNTEAVEESIGG